MWCGSGSLGARESRLALDCLAPQKRLASRRNAVQDKDVGKPRARQLSIVRQETGRSRRDRCRDLNAIGCTQVMLRPEPRSLLRDRRGYGERFDIVGVEQNPPVVVRKLEALMAKRVYQNLRKSQDGSDDAELPLGHGAKERTQGRKVKGILFDEVDEGRCIKAYDGTTERVYPFHDERSWFT